MKFETRRPLAVRSTYVAMVVAAVASSTSCRPPSDADAPRPASSVRAAVAVHAEEAAHAHADLEAIPATSLCVGAGRVASAAEHQLRVDDSGMRAVVAGDHSRSAELAFTYRGPSATTAPLANGELRRQIGLKLRAMNTCNVVYVMWHVDPSPGVFVSVKRNLGASTHEQCGARGYDNIPPEESAKAAPLDRDRPHVLRADLEGSSLRVTADGVVVWRGHLPIEVFAIDGPAGIRSDNGTFDFELRVPGGARPPAPCPRP